MRIVRTLPEIARCPEIVAVYGERSERAILHRLEKGQIPGSFQSGATWFLDVDTFMMSIRNATRTGRVEPVRSPLERLAADEQEESA